MFDIFFDGLTLEFNPSGALDTRSFRLNDEANLNIYAADFARQQVDVFNADLSRSRRVSLNEWQQRPLSEKFLEHAASLIGAQL